MDPDTDPLLLTFFFALRTILSKDSIVEDRRKEARRLQIVYSTWQALYPDTPPLHSIACVEAPGDINITAWELATKLHTALQTASK